MDEKSESRGEDRSSEGSVLENSRFFRLLDQFKPVD